MLHSLLHHINHVLWALLATVIFILPSGIHADPVLPEDNSDYLLPDEAESSSHMLNSLWLEQGMKEAPSYYEDQDALYKLAQGAVKKYWATLLNKNNHSSQLPDMNKHVSENTDRSSTSIDIDLSADTIKLGLAYSF